MLIGNYCKFTRSTKAAELRAKLLATGDRILAEASPRDNIWGIGMSAEAAKQNRREWGQNLLGKALMDIRGLLRHEESVRIRDPEYSRLP